MRARPAGQVIVVGVAVALLVAGLALTRDAPAPVDELGQLALGLTIIITAALAGGHLAGVIGQPAVLGELLAGTLLGNAPGLSSLQFIGADPYIDILARIGMLLLLFEVGVELSVRDLFAVGRSSFAVAVMGTVFSLAIGTGMAALLLPDTTIAAHLFLGASITATSVGITARVLKDMGASRSTEAKIILGAAVVDDILALVVLGAITAWAGSAEDAAPFSALPVLALVMKTVGFLALTIAIGLRFTPGWFHAAARLRTGGALLGAGLCLCFFLSWAASAIGLAALVGAFAAGLVLEDVHSDAFVQRGERPLGQLLQPMTSFLVPVFFVLVGFRTNLAVLGRPALLAFAIALSLAAVAGKLSCALGVVDRRARKLTVAIGMIPRGEVSLVFAALGSAVVRPASVPLLDERGYTAIVSVVILTTLATPPALKWSLRRRDEAGDGD